MENYSIDESFLDLSNFYDIDLEAYGREIKCTVEKWTGIPVTVGIGTTKILAKVANRVAKKNKDYAGVKVLEQANDIIEALKDMAVEDVWGIGRKYARMLNEHKVFNAYQLATLPLNFVQKKLSIVGVRMVEELRGTPVIGLETQVQDKKGICSAKSFGKGLTELPMIKKLWPHILPVVQKSYESSNQLPKG